MFLIYEKNKREAWIIHFKNWFLSFKYINELGFQKQSECVGQGHQSFMFLFPKVQAMFKSKATVNLLMMWKYPQNTFCGHKSALLRSFFGSCPCKRHSWDIVPMTRHSGLPQPSKATPDTQDSWNAGPVCKTLASFSCREVLCLPYQPSFSESFLVSAPQYGLTVAITTACFVSALLFICAFFSVHF